MALQLAAVAIVAGVQHSSAKYTGWKGSPIHPDHEPMGYWFSTTTAYY